MSRLLPYVSAAIFSLSLLAYNVHADTDVLPIPETAVVFTGQFNRVEKGLELLERGDIQRLLISGVTPGSGIRAETFSEQFSLSPKLIAARKAQRLVLGVRATTTIENGVETACWLEMISGVKEILLITSSRHLERATVSLQNALPDLSIVSLAVEDPVTRFADKNIEAERKATAATRLLGLLPEGFMVSKELADCSDAQFR